jgi:hypothetical protein
VLFLPFREMNGHDCTTVPRRNEMNSTIESEQSAAPAEASKPKAKRPVAKKGKPAKKATKAKKAAGK